MRSHHERSSIAASLTIRVCLRDPEDRDGDDVDAHDLERAALSRRTLRLLDPLLDQERALQGRREDAKWLEAQFERLRRHAGGEIVEE